MKLNRKSFFAKLMIIASVFSLGLLIWTNPKFAGSFSLGCITMIFNFYSLMNLLEGIFGEQTTKAGSYLFLLMGKFAVLGLVVFGMVRFAHVDLLGFGLGFFLVAISATYATSSLQN